MRLHSGGGGLNAVEVEGSLPPSPSHASSPSQSRVSSSQHASSSTTRRRLSLTVPRPRTGSPADSPTSARGPWSPVHRTAADSPVPRRGSTLPPPPGSGGGGPDHHFKHNKSDGEDDYDTQRTRRSLHSTRSRPHLWQNSTSHAWHSVAPNISPIPPSPDPNNILPLASVASQSDGQDSTGESSPRTSSSSGQYGWSGDSEDYSEEDEMLREKTAAASWWGSQYDSTRHLLPRSLGLGMSFAPRTTRRLLRSVRSIFPPYNQHTPLHSAPSRKRPRRRSASQGPIWRRATSFAHNEPWGLALMLVGFLFFVVIVAGTIKYILDPDKRALPWREYCQEDFPSLYSLQDPTSAAFPVDQTHKSLAGSDLVLAPITPSSQLWPWPGSSHNPYTTDLAGSALDTIEPTTVYLGVFTVDHAVERRNVIRQTYDSHPNSRKPGSEGVRLRFIMGRPSDEFADAVAAENAEHDDIVVLDIDENMNNGKTFHYFSWAAENATVPDYEYSSAGKAIYRGEKRPAYIAKADDDAFIVLSELERHLRGSPRKMTHWGYLVNNWFMAGECYAVSHDLAEYIATSPEVAEQVTGKEDKRMSHWLHEHPEREKITWVSERTWIYDHPRAHTVYSHGFLFPAEVASARKRRAEGWQPPHMSWRWSNSVDSFSTVSRFGEAYSAPAPFTPEQQVEALIEGSELSQLRDAPRPRTPAQREEQKLKIESAMAHRPTRRERFLGDERERGGTVIVHFIKKNEWFWETAAALLD